MNEAEIDALLSTYRPSISAMDIVQSSKIILLVGITGAGKNTLKEELLKDEMFYDFISHTTRDPRTNLGVKEKNGVDYFFVTTEEAVHMIKNGEFIEAKKVHSNIYGTAINGLKPSIESGRIAVNDVDVQGVEEYKAISDAVHAIFVLPPSFEEWNRRRLARYNNEIDPKDNEARLHSAKLELEHAQTKGYYDFVINDDVAAAAETVRNIVNGTIDTARHEKAERVVAALVDKLSTH